MIRTKPPYIFHRDAEWRALAEFASRAGGRPQLGIISGRRRQGKTFLLEALVRATDGFYFGAQQATQTESLRQFADALAEWADTPAPARLDDWNQAITYLFSAGRTRTGPLVIDEFPYLVNEAPALPSILQHALDRNAFANSGPSLLLSGSAMSVMGRLLAGNAPLRGRANLELIIKPFGFAEAASYWGVRDPRLAVLVHAVVGGTPAYRRFANEDSPYDLADFDLWILRSVLNVTSPLFREARYLLDEEASVRDSALYHSVLAAVAHGNNTRGGIAGYIGRKGSDIGHHLHVLEDSGLLHRDPDVLRSGRSTYRIAEPLITFYQVVMRPEWGRLESGRTEPVWKNSQGRFLSQVVGPHFEQLCRDWMLNSAGERLAEPVSEVGAATITDPSARRQIEVDIIALATAEHGTPRRVVAIGEAKWGDQIGVRHIERLRRMRELLRERGYDIRATKLVCFSGEGFDRAVTALDDVIAVGLQDLYTPG